jgi:mono/diheme cytochrome c family protein
MGRIDKALLSAGLMPLLFCSLAEAQVGKIPPPETRLIDSLDGYALYQSYCAVCHGKDAKGDGPMARVLKDPPLDLTQIAVRNSGVFPAQKVARIISGESEMTSHGTREMPLWGPIFSQIAWDQDLGRVRVANLTKYIESIQSNPRPGPGHSK